MTVKDKLSQQRAAKLDSQVIRNVLDTLTSAEKGDPTPEYPLRGTVHISGIGQISVSALKAELAKREATK
jgi:hypothetical protein